MLAALLLQASTAAPPQRPVVPRRAGPPNVLVVVLDDVGTDAIGAYGHPEAPCTPFLDGMAQTGFLARRAYANTVCSPTRSQLQTGRHSFRTGVGFAIAPANPARAQGLSTLELTLPWHLQSQGWATGLVGKWHLLGEGQAPTHPNELGYEHFAGHLMGVLLRGYDDWDRTVDGLTAVETEYATTRTLLDALDTAGSMSAPWFLTVSFHAAHAPFHVPPPHLCPGDPACICTGAPSGPREEFEAMVESLDETIETLVTSLETLTSGNLTTIVIGDNGTPVEVQLAPTLRGGKEDLYEGGIRVPLIARGPGIVQGESGDLILATDLFATVCEIAGLPVHPEAVDSVSFLPVLHGEAGARTWVYSETFLPNGLPFTPTSHERTVIEERWKLIRRSGLPTGDGDELFDLTLDPAETSNLLDGQLTPEAESAYDRLQACLDQLGVG